MSRRWGIFSCRQKTDENKKPTVVMVKAKEMPAAAVSSVAGESRSKGSSDPKGEVKAGAQLRVVTSFVSAPGESRSRGSSDQTSKAEVKLPAATVSDEQKAEIAKVEFERLVDEINLGVKKLQNFVSKSVFSSYRKTILSSPNLLENVKAAGEKIRKAETITIQEINDIVAEYKLWPSLHEIANRDRIVKKAKSSQDVESFEEEQRLELPGQGFCFAFAMMLDRIDVIASCITPAKDAFNSYKALWGIWDIAVESSEDNIGKRTNAQSAGDILFVYDRSQTKWKASLLPEIGKVRVKCEIELGHEFLEELEKLRGSNRLQTTYDRFPIIRLLIANGKKARELQLFPGHTYKPFPSDYEGYCKQMSDFRDVIQISNLCQLYSYFSEAGAKPKLDREMPALKLPDAPSIELFNGAMDLYEDFQKLYRLIKNRNLLFGPKAQDDLAPVPVVVCRPSVSSQRPPSVFHQLVPPAAQAKSTHSLSHTQSASIAPPPPVRRSSHHSAGHLMSTSGLF